MYEVGSLLPLSSSSSEASPCLSDSFFERRIENTEAASVELITEPMSRLSYTESPNTPKQNSAVMPAVSTTPRLASRIAWAATGRASFQLVPKPP